MALHNRLTISPLRRALPTTATEVQEWQWTEEGLLAQDYAYQLKAKITEQEFLEYIHKLELTPHTPERKYGLGFVLSWGIFDSPQRAWWDPSPDTTNTYVYDGGSWWTYAKWENGYIYVVSYNI
jgi:hypothetical protein